MKKIFLSMFVAVVAITTSVSSAKAAEVELGADLVSSYVWRGAYQTGASIQPAVSLGFGNFTIGAWGSTPLGLLTASEDGIKGPKEVDFSLGYSIGDFTIGVCDYWWSGQGAKYFKAKDHYYEATLGYYFGDKFPLSLAVSTMFAGADKDGDKQQYSTYIDLSYGFAIKSVDCSVGVGLTPMKGAYTGIYDDDFSVCSVSLTASKAIKLSSTYSMPIFVQTILSPSTDDAFLVLGLSF